MNEKWQSFSIRELASNAPQSFTDGDWVEAPHIRDSGIRLIQTGNIGIGHFIDRSKKYISQNSFNALNCKEVFPGDLLICRLAEPIGRACFAPDLGERMITSVDVTILRVDKTSFDPRFIAFGINTPEALRQCEVVAGGTTRQRISRSNLGKVNIKAPKVGVQRRIAEILSTLDETIDQTETLIAKMQQVKAGLMHDLFTRGVTPDGHLRPTREQAPDLYKESPLGWIPKEWDVGELRNWLSYISYGFTNPMPEADEGPYMLTAADITEGRIQYETCRRTTVMAYERLLTQKSRPKIGDVLLTKDGTLGRVAVVDRTDVCINQSVAVLRPIDARHSNFLAAMLSAPLWQQKMISDAGGSTIKHIYITIVDKMLIGWPRNPEELDKMSGLIQNCITVIDDEEDNLRKLRLQKFGLMHDLLTGLVRV